MVRKPHKNKAFVLILILAVLVVATTVLAGWAYRVGRSALESGEIARDIQRKWGCLSSRRAFLSQPDFFDRIMVEESQEKEEIVASVNREIELCDYKYKLILADEQAKANVGSLISNDKEKAGSLISKLISDNDEFCGVQLKLDESQGGYDSFDMVFDYGNDPANLLNISRLTCWSDGLVNFRRADKPTLEAVTAGILSATEVDQVIALRNESQDLSLTGLLQKLALGEKRPEELKKVLTDTSNSKSLWVLCDDGNRSWYYFYVKQKDNDSEDMKTRSYQW